MGRFGSLFRKSDEKEKAEPSSNPYAQQQYTDTYAQSNSYAAAQNRQVPSGLPSGPRTGLPSGPRPGSSAPPPYTQSPSLYSKDSPTFPADSKRQDSGYQTGSPAFSNYQQSPNLPSGGSSPAFPNYQQNPSLPSAGSGGYGNDGFGAPAGYGSSRYNNDAAYGQNNHHAPPQKTTGGYGGLGGGDNELFSSDYVPPSQRNQMARPALPEDYDQMTEEQKQEADINYKKQEIKQLRGETEDSLDRSLAKLEVAHNIADDAMGNLARQRNMLYNANQSLGEAKIQARVADANVKDLQDANKSMFNFYAMSRKRRDGLNDERLVAELQEKEEKQQMMREIQQGKARTAQRMQGGQPSSSYDLPKNDRSKYLFESSDEDEQAEARIEDKQTRLARGVGLLHQKAVAMGDEVDDQNPMIEGLSDKTSRVHDKIIVNKNKLDRFK